MDYCYTSLNSRLFFLSGVAWLMCGFLLVGCSREDESRTPADIVDSWSDLGMYLPPKEDITFIRENLPESLKALRAGMNAPESSLRMSTAYVIGELGSDASALTQELLDRIDTETVPIVRVYSATAVADIDRLNENQVQQLKDAFHSEEEPQAKTHLAGALVRVDNFEEQNDAKEWLLQSLEPLTPENEVSDIDIFWECRWGAIAHLRHLHHLDDLLLPLLKQLHDHPETPKWVIDQQIMPALREMEHRSASDTTPSSAG